MMSNIVHIKSLLLCGKYRLLDWLHKTMLTSNMRYVKIVCAKLILRLTKPKEVAYE